MSDDPDLETVAGLLEDSVTRAILIELSTEPKCVNELKDRCDVSGPTIYRRLDRLTDCHLIVERIQPDTESGHHRKMYAPNLKRVTIELDDGAFTLSVEHREDMADRFTQLIENF